jgi:hypothetical protein
MKNIDAVLAIRKEIINKSNLDIEVILSLIALDRYYLGLQHITTSNNAICLALKIPVEAGTRYKAHLERNNNLVASVEGFICPYSRKKVQFLSTNPAEFDRLIKPITNQLNLFEDGES